MNQHPFNPWSFVAGALFLLIAAAGAFVTADLASPRDLLTAAPVALILLGVGGLALTFKRTS
ncbi:MAG: hypothetical protein P1U38_07540 [Aeromicrobium sp.]|uniref:hypothetical protein n=1 Tax=Aeromicrobium sp. TaxID=1871063 RepID=UPI0025BB60C4|nr:hypothetical protein [Aeromicrobium sp.]MCK5891244.1 hypothetical protein [Aeromicrobium sp.]MDF1704611.1 hypothetical protein [Aeromicrobium sp.]